MVQEDYIERHLNKLHLIFAKILKLNHEGNYDKVEEVIKETVKNITGLNIIAISLFGLQDILRMMSGYDENIMTNREKLTSVSDLLYEYGEVENNQGKEKSSLVFYEKSLLLYIYALKLDEKNILKKDRSRIKKIVKAIGWKNIAEPLKTDIVKLLEKKG